jgi:hypothetical protein
MQSYNRSLVLRWIGIVWVLRHDLISRSFRTFGEGAYNGQKISARVTVDARSDLSSVKLIAELKTPFHEKVALSLLHTGMPTNFKCDAELSYSGRKQHDITITFKQTGNLRAFSTSADIVCPSVHLYGILTRPDSLSVEYSMWLFLECHSLCQRTQFQMHCSCCMSYLN